VSEPEEFSPPWLAEKIEARLAFMVEHGALDIARESGARFVVSFLNEGDEHMSDEERERWERTCDRCGKYVPPEPERDNYTEFYTGHMARTVEGVQIFMAFGICGDCKRETNQKGTQDEHVE
jgi:hypothetical protein